MHLGFIFKTCEQTQRRALEQEHLPYREVGLKASISKRLFDSSALVEIFPRPGALATPACTRIKRFFSLSFPFHCCVKTEQSINTVYLRQHFVSLDLQNALTCAS